MRYIDLNSKKGLTNLFADYIVKHFDQDTIIEITDCGAFFVVMGETPKTDVVDLGKIKESFISEYKNYQLENINLIDLIKYNVEVKHKPIWFKYYATERPIYSEEQMEYFNQEYPEPPYEYKRISNFSEFPHGYGLNRSRFIYYFNEYVSNHLFNLTNADSIELYYNELEFIDDLKVKIKLNGSHVSSKIVWDLIMDVFYVEDNMKELRTIISDYDILKDLTEPVGFKPWLIKNKVEDMFIL
jgi:hypothetical protein